MALSDLELIQNFDKLPDDAIVPEKVSRIIRHTSEWTDRRHKPLPRIQISPGRFGNRVGDIRAVNREREVA